MSCPPTRLVLQSSKQPSKHGFSLFGIGIYLGIGIAFNRTFNIQFSFFHGQPADMQICTFNRNHAAVGFQNALRQRDAGRNAVAFHMRHGDVLVAVDVLLAGLARLRMEGAEPRKE